MRKLDEVEEAKALMAEAIEWSVVKWLKEKKRVRRVADIANAALDALERETKESWSKALKSAYAQLSTPAAAPAAQADEQVSSLAKAVKKADDAARRAHDDAEETFDQAERELSTRLAREGCRKAIASWELHEQAIRKAEAAIIPSQSRF